MNGISDTRAFRNLLKAAYPGLLAKTSISLDDTGLGGEQELYNARLVGPGLPGNGVKLSGFTAAEVVAGLKGAVKCARRLHDTTVDLNKIANIYPDYTAEQVEEMKQNLLSRPSKHDYEKLVATYRTQADRLRQQLQAA